MKNVEILTRTIPSKPRSDNYSVGGAVINTGGGTSSSGSDPTKLDKSVWAANFEELTDPDGNEYLYLSKPIVMAAGATMYAGKDILIPSIFEGLPLDQTSIGWKDGKLSVLGSIGGGISSAPVTGAGNAITSAFLSDDGKVLSLVKGATFLTEHQSLADYAKKTDIPSLTGYATESWVNNKGYLIATSQDKSNWNTAFGWGNHAGAGYAKTSDLANYVTLATEQEITGAKTFTADTTVFKGVTIGGVSVKKSEDGVLILDGNLLVTGGVTMHALGSRSAATIMDGVLVDGTTIVKENGKLVVVGGGGGLDTARMWAELGSAGSEQIAISHLTTALGGYVKKAGDVITGALEFNWGSSHPQISIVNGEYNIIAMQSVGWERGMASLSNDRVTTLAKFGFYGHDNSLLYAYIGNRYDMPWQTWNASGTNINVPLTVSGNTVLHAGNYNSYAPTLTGGGANGTWGINISGNAAYASNATRLYASESPYNYGDSSPYYMYMNYNSAVGRWRLKVNPATPEDIEVRCADIAGLSDKANWLEINSTLEYGRSGLNYFNSTLPAGNAANSNVAPTADWYHVIRMNHGNAAGYYVDLAACFHHNGLYYRRIQQGSVAGWYRIMDEVNLGDYMSTRSAQWSVNGILSTNPQLAASYESNEINVANNSVLDGLNHAIRFRWYDNYYQLGIIRGGATNDLGFAICRDTTPIAKFQSNNVIINPRLITDNGIYCNKSDGNPNIEMYTPSNVWNYTRMYINGNANTFWDIATNSINTDTPYAIEFRYNGRDNIKAGVKNDGTLFSTANGNTVTIGSQNSGYCHIYNSANIPFIFNKTVDVIGHVRPYGHVSYNLGGNDNYYWNAVYARYHISDFIPSWADTWTNVLQQLAAFHCNADGKNEYVAANTSQLFGHWQNVINNVGYRTTYVIGSRRGTSGYGEMVLWVCGDDNQAGNAGRYLNLTANGQLKWTGSGLFENNLTATEISATSWLRNANSNCGWYNEAHTGGMYMNDNDQVKVYNNKVLYNDGSRVWGIGGHNCGLKLYNPSHIGINLQCDAYMWGIYCNQNGNMYIGRRSGHTNDSGGIYYYTFGAGLLTIDGNLLLSGGATMHGSDITKKDIITHILLPLDKIANAPLIRYRWKDNRNTCTNIGGSAQYTNSLLPECAYKVGDTWSMDYATTAYAFAVSTAVHFADYIKKQATKEDARDIEIKELKQRIEILERRTA